MPKLPHDAPPAEDPRGPPEDIPTYTEPDRFIDNIADMVLLKRVANGWIMEPGKGGDQFTHVAQTPMELADYVRKWAAAQEKQHARR